MDEIYVCIFRSIHDVMRAEAVLKRSGVPFQLVPVPTSVHSDCGMAVSLEPGEVDKATRALEAQDAAPEAVYHRSISGKFRKVNEDQRTGYG